MYTIAKKFNFSASHQLTGLPDGHQCSRLHGHNYIVELVLRASKVDENGMVVDYGELKAFKEHLDAYYDHRHLNDVLSFNTTAENLARHFYEWARQLFPDLVAVRVSETPKTWAEYRPG